MMNLADEIIRKGSKKPKFGKRMKNTLKSWLFRKN